jgi:hypothetical protein
MKEYFCGEREVYHEIKGSQQELRHSAPVPVNAGAPSQDKS